MHWGYGIFGFSPCFTHFYLFAHICFTHFHHIHSYELIFTHGMLSL